MWSKTDRWIQFSLPHRTKRITNKKDGYRQRNVRQFLQSAQLKAQFGYLRWVTPVYRCLLLFCMWRHLATSRESKAHFGLPGYAPETIAVNVTWMERRFNAGQTHRSMYPSIFNRLRAIARYWSPLHLTPPLGVFPLEFQGKVWSSKTRIMGLPGSEDNLTIGWAVSTQYQRVTDRRTDRRPAYSLAVTCVVGLTHVKKKTKPEKAVKQSRVREGSRMGGAESTVRRICGKGGFWVLSEKG